MEKNIHHERGQAKNNSTVLLIDADGLSHYTAYLAYGLSKYRKIILCGLSYENYIITGASMENNIEFHNLGERLPQKTSLISKLIVYPLSLFVALLKISITTNFDIVHFQGHIPLFFLLIPLLKWKAKHISWTLHEVKVRPYYNKGIKGKFETWYVRTVTQITLLTKCVDSIIVHGTHLKNLLRSKGVDKKKIYVVPHMDYKYLLKTSNTDVKDEVSFTDYILLFGRIVPYKGIEFLIDAVKLARLHSEYEFNVLIAGKGNISHIIRKLDSSDYQFIYVCNKFIPYHRIPDLFRRAKFLILPYSDASQSGIIPLAYTFSKPVIVSDVGSLSEFVINDKTGFIFKAGDVTQLSNLIVDLVKNPNKCKEMGKNALKLLVQEMSLEKCSETINNIYNNDK